MKNNLAFFTLVIGAGLSLASLSGCGQSNPAAGYPNLSNSIPANQASAPQAQSYLNTSLFHFDGIDSLVFVEGSLSSYLITPVLSLPGVVYTLSAVNLPAGASFTAATEPENLGSYWLTWNPAHGTLGPDEAFKKLKFIINVTMVSSADAASAAIMNQISGQHLVDLTVVQSHAQPVIEKIDVAQTDLMFGDKIQFTVSVRESDLDISSNLYPSLVIKEADSTNLPAPYLQPVAELVTVSAKPIRAVDGKFVFSGSFDSHWMSLKDVKDFVYARFVLVALSPYHAASPDRLVEIKVKKPIVKVDVKPITPPSGGK